jgi:LmbE family N-acetylglucosaminyl deacetylase
VIVTDGGGSSRNGIYAFYTDEQMKTVRREEQRKAAHIGDYSAQIQLSHPSKSVKDPQNTSVTSDLREVLLATCPEVVYLHNPADKHDTHIAVLTHCLKALRSLPKELRPKKVYGGEVWRSLDWLLDADKQVLDSSKQANLAASLVGVFDSQISGGKRYDLATAGRRLANATYFESHSTDKIAAIDWAMDLTPLIEDENLSLVEYTKSFVARFSNDVEVRLAKFGNK